MTHFQPVALSGSSELIWAAALNIPLAHRHKPARPSFLCIEIQVIEGCAGIGWYDDSGLAEEIYVRSSAQSRTVSLTVWQPQGCTRVIARNVRNKPVSVKITGIEWRPLQLPAPDLRSPEEPDEGSDGLFLDQEFSGQPAETLWQRWKQARFDRQKKYRLLRRIVRLAWEKCPGYREHWKSHGWHPSNLRTLEDADDIPIIAKETIRANVDQFTVMGDNTLFDFTTSGTTGSPFSFKYTSLLNAAHLSAVAIAASYGDGSKLPWQQKALIVKRSVRGASATGAGGSMLINAAAVKDASLVRQLVESYKPTLLFGWPSYAGDISAALQGEYEFRIAILGSENIFDAQVLEAGSIAKVVVGTYGLSEGAGFAMRCHGCGAYAELDTHGLLSLHRRPDGLFDIIGTSFWSRGTLFIRYNNADVTHGPIERCPTCPPDSTLYFKPPSGRSQEFVEDQHGARHALAMIVGAERIVRLLRGIELFDFVQIVPGRLLFRYVTENRQPIDEPVLVDEFRKIVGDELLVGCRYDARILDLRDARGPGEKWKILKQADFDA